tara:strand:- start:159 stop:359 length:201 start_codon:yes stop_codon:yes gene_type:complete
MIFRALVCLCIVLVIVEIAVHRHVIFVWEGWPGFYALWGFVSLFTIVILGKQLRRLIKRDEDYYDD